MIAAASSRMPWYADVERGDGGDPGDARRRPRASADAVLVDRRGPDRGDDLVARDRRRRARRSPTGARFWATSPTATTIARPTSKRADGQRRPARVAESHAPGEALLGPQEPAERDAGDPAERREDERRSRRSRRAGRVDDERPDGRARRPRRAARRTRPATATTANTTTSQRRRARPPAAGSAGRERRASIGETAAGPDGRLEGRGDRHGDARRTTASRIPTSGTDRPSMGTLAMLRT